MTIDREATRHFLDNYIFTSKDLFYEVKCIRAKVVYQTNRIVRDENSMSCGWFTSTLEVLEELRRVNPGVSCYICPNPIKTQGRNPKFRNRIQYARRGSACTDLDIAEIRWLIVDIDPAPHPSGRSRKSTNSTDEELEHCVSVRDRIVAENPEIRDASIPGISGNGAFILIRTPEYSPSESVSDSFGRFLRHLSDEYSTAEAVVDTNTKNPSRAIAIPGTIKYKAPEETLDRPYRRVSVAY